jgi:hypothetical protein
MSQSKEDELMHALTDLRVTRTTASVIFFAAWAATGSVGCDGLSTTGYPQGFRTAVGQKGRRAGGWRAMSHLSSERQELRASAGSLSVSILCILS